MVSVPLRGYGFEIKVKAAVVDNNEKVSVPLRGYGFEIKRMDAFNSNSFMFPSPYGDMVLKLIYLLQWKNQ